MHFRGIAEIVGVSPRTVEKRYQRMREKDTIFGTTIILDLSKIGYEGTAYIKIVSAPGHEKTATMAALRKIPDVDLTVEIVGEYDILAIAPVRNYTDLFDMVKTIREIPGVEQAEAVLGTDTIFPAPKAFNNLTLTT